MISITSPVRGALKTAMAVGAVTATLAGASLATSGSAEAHVRPVHGGVHPGFGHFHAGFGHRVVGFRYGVGHPFGGYRVVHRGFGFRHYGFGVPGFGYRVGVPYGYAVRACVPGFRFVPGLGCRRVLPLRHYAYLPAYRPVRVYDYGFRPHRILHRAVYPIGYGHRAFGYGFGRPFGHIGHGFRTVGFGHPHGGFHHGGFGGHVVRHH